MPCLLHCLLTSVARLEEAAKPKKAKVGSEKDNVEKKGSSKGKAKPKAKLKAKPKAKKDKESESENESDDSDGAEEKQEEEDELDPEQVALLRFTIESVLWFSQMTVPQLKEKLGALGKTTSGNKSALGQLSAACLVAEPCFCAVSRLQKAEAKKGNSKQKKKPAADAGEMFEIVEPQTIQARQPVCCG